jgi:uncharacterized protein involved in exopolysaccharide biosynthesis
MARIETKKESTFKDFLEVIFRRKWIVIGIVGVATVTVLILNMREPAIYESVARMLVKRGEALGVFSQSIRTLTWEEEIASQIELIKSQVVLSRAQELLPEFLPAAYSGPTEIAYGGVNSGVVSTSNVLWVTYTAMDPLFCEAAVNAIAQSYREYYQEVRTPPEMEDFFLQELQILKEEIEYWRRRKQQVESEWGIIDIREQGRNTLLRLERYRNELDRVVAERLEIEEIVDKLERFQDLDPEEQIAASKGLLDLTLSSTIDVMRRRLVDLKIQESEFKVRFTDTHKELMQVRGQIDELHAMMEREVRSLIIIFKSRYEISIRKEQMFRELVAGMEVETVGLPEKGVEIERISKTLDRLENNYSELSEQHMNARISIASNPEWTITILTPATPAYQKKTRDYVRMALGPVFSIIVALGFAFFVDNLDHSIKNVSEAEEVLDLPVLASFPDTQRK